ncbi:hypothetical protein HYT84_00225 [Candidatus Micrarchaeota archaeon]|nr:hypothetical protein [Candidatus Micrarchaeota archaeon]
MRSVKIYVILALLIIILGCTSSIKPEEKPSDNLTNSTNSASNKAELEKIDFPEESLDYDELVEFLDDSEFLSIDSSLENISTEGLPQVHYFFSPRCFASKEVAPRISQMKNKTQSEVLWVEHNVLTQKGLDDFNYYAKLMNFSTNERVVPLFLYSDKRLKGRREINETSLVNAINIVKRQSD